MSASSPVQVAQVIEIRARHDRNRLLATYDPVRLELRLFHRGRVLVLKLDELDVPSEATGKGEG